MSTCTSGTRNQFIVTFNEEVFEHKEPKIEMVRYLLETILANGVPDRRDAQVAIFEIKAIFPNYFHSKLTCMSESKKKHVKLCLGRTFGFRLSGQMEEKTVLGMLEASRAIETAEIDGTVDLDEECFLTQLNAMAGTREFERALSRWAYEKLKVPEALAFVDKNQIGNFRPIIAVIDSGVDKSHKDLKRVDYWQNQGERFLENDEDDDGNGYADDLYGWDWYYDRPLEKRSDDTGHGTHCLGIIAARPRRNSPLPGGVCPNAIMMPLKVFDRGGSANISQIAKAIVYAANHGANIISMSFSTKEPSRVLERALADAFQTSLLIASAGNKGENIGAQPHFPAAYPMVLGVEAWACNYTRAHFSNSGYDLKLPGKAILSTVPGNLTRFWSGTSMAAPYASAIAGLALTVNPELTNSDLYRILKDQLGTGHGDAAATVVLAKGFIPGSAEEIPMVRTVDFVDLGTEEGSDGVTPATSSPHSTDSGSGDPTPDTDGGPYEDRQCHELGKLTAQGDAASSQIQGLFNHGVGFFFYFARTPDGPFYRWNARMLAENKPWRKVLPAFLEPGHAPGRTLYVKANYVLRNQKEVNGGSLFNVTFAPRNSRKVEKFLRRLGSRTY